MAVAGADGAEPYRALAEALMGVPPQHFPDPEDADRSFDAENLSVNLRRAQLVAVVASADMAVEAALGTVRGKAALTAMAIGGAVALLAFAVAAARANRASVSAHVQRAVPLGLIVFLLILAQILAGAGSAPDAQAYGYAIVLVGVAALFKVPPRLFAVIAAATYAALLGRLAASGFSLGVALQDAGTGGFALVAAVMIRTLLYRARQRDHHLRAIIAQQNRAFSKANQELAQRNIDVRETMAIAAHDLRSPMSALHDLLRLAADRPGMAPDMARTLFVEASHSVGAMLDLINKLLQAHQAEHSGPPELRAHELNAMARDAVERIAISAAMVKVVVRLVEGEAAIVARTNEDAVARILDNLLSNAIRYSPRGGQVYVSCRSAGATATVEVMDEGAGVPVGERGRLFDKFHRGSQLPVAGNVGAGLGLYIAQSAAISISARLDYRQRSQGGSIFRLTLPMEGH